MARRFQTSNRQHLTSQIREFLTKTAGSKGWSRYNSILGIVKAIFTTALESNAIIEIPGIRGVKKKDSVWARRKQVTTKKLVPSVEQFRAIVANIRSQEFADTCEEAADSSKPKALWASAKPRSLNRDAIAEPQPDRPDSPSKKHPQATSVGRRHRSRRLDTRGHAPHARLKLVGDVR